MFASRYNRWIDDHDEDFPGATAGRVAFGVGVTLGSIVFVVVVWRGVREALRLAALLAAAFMVAGAPMIVGDWRRDQPFSPRLRKR